MWTGWEGRFSTVFWQRLSKIQCSIPDVLRIISLFGNNSSEQRVSSSYDDDCLKIFENEESPTPLICDFALRHCKTVRIIASPQRATNGYPISSCTVQKSLNCRYPATWQNRQCRENPQASLADLLRIYRKFTANCEWFLLHTRPLTVNLLHNDRNSAYSIHVCQPADHPTMRGNLLFLW